MSSGHKLLGVQYLRAVAALMVVYYHITQQIPAYTPFLEFHQFLDSRSLGAGVHIFFVISGFIMLVTTERIGPADFIARRLIRIVPLYWLLTAALLGFSSLHYFQHTPVTAELVWKSLLFVPYLAASGRVEPLLNPGWTLNVEMVFYGVFALALLISRRYRMILVSFVFIAAVLAGLADPDRASSPFFFLMSRAWMLEFCTGMLIGYFYLQRKPHLSKWTIGVLVVGGFGLLLSSLLVSTEDPIPYVLPATFIMIGVVAYEQRFGVALRRFPMLLGDASYSIYLSHIFALGFMGVIWRRAGIITADTPHAIMFAIAAFATTIGFALLVYWLIEKPLLDFLSARIRRVDRAPANCRVTNQTPA